MKNKNKIAQNKTIIVLGMHRSGTSMIAGVLKKLGVHMGDELLGKSSSNPHGHFEDLDFLHLNIKILRAAQGSWANPPEYNTILKQKKKFASKIKKMITGKNKNNIWGWKDPRTSLTIELFLPYLMNPQFIVCYRKPQAVAKSLNKRNGMSIKAGLELKKIYDNRINTFFEKKPELSRLNVFYKNVTNNSKKRVNQIINFLNIEVNQNQYREACNFIL